MVAGNLHGNGLIKMSDNGGYNDISGGRDYIDDGGSIGNNGSGNSKQ